MGTTYLLDTNIAIYFLNGVLSPKALELIEEGLNEKGSYISVITKIELLGWQTFTPDQMRAVIDFVNDCAVIPLTDAIVEKTIEIRRVSKTKLPDAIIAATALIHDFTLLSRNDDDFRKIPGLKYINPF